MGCNNTFPGTSRTGHTEYLCVVLKEKKIKSASCVLSHKINKAMIKEDKGRHGHLRCYFQETSGSD